MYGKVFSSLWDGTLGQNWEVWSLFVFMLSNCDADGHLDMTQESISLRSGIPLDKVRDGIAVLSEPDDRSRSQAEDGRRIILIDDHRDWGWLIVNHSKYRALQDRETVRAQTNERVRIHRLKRSVTVGNGKKRHADADTDANADAEKRERQAPRTSARTVSEAVQRELETKYPQLDVQGIIEKLLNHAKPYKNWDIAARNWCKEAQQRGWDRKPQERRFGDD